jgi:hypothetical protein
MADDLLSDVPPETPPPGNPPPDTTTPPPPTLPPGSMPPTAAPKENVIPKTVGERLAPDPNKEWLKTLPDDLQDNENLARYSSTEALARAYLNSHRMLVMEKVPIPKDPNDTEAWDAYYKAGGRPDEPKQYIFQKPETLPEGVTWDSNMEGWWRQAAFESGLSQRQAQKLVDQYRDRFIANVDLQNRQVNQQLNSAKLELQRDWGSEYEAKRALAKAAFAEMPEDTRNAAIANGLARMPSFVKYLYDVKAKTLGEMSPRPAGTIGDTPDGLRQKIADYRTQYAAALNDVNHPEHDMRVSAFTAMYQKLYLTEAAA